MQRRPSGSDEGADLSNPLPVNVTVNASANNFNVLDATASTRTQGRAPNHHQPPRKPDNTRRTSADLRPSTTRSRRSGNFTWTPSHSRNGSAEKGSLLFSVESGVIPPTMASKSDEDSDDMEKTSDAKAAGRRLRSRSAWTTGILTIVVSLIGIGFLAAILNSSATRCLDVKGCLMSYMRPSYAKLSDFDTEHTRFGSKYSLYLYREQGIDDDIKVCGGGLA